MSITETEIQAQVEQERKRLLEDAGLADRTTHFERPMERPFTAEQRGTTTILVSGLTIKHEEFVLGCLEGLGYLCDRVLRLTRNEGTLCDLHSSL